jgi:predicted dehydrogenase
VERLARQYGCQGVTDSARIPEGTDSVLVAAPNHLHGPLAVQMLRQGCHVLCEKPLTITSAEGENLIALATQEQRLLVVGHQLRFLPSVQRLRALLQSGALGAVRSVDLSMGWASEWQSVSNFYQDRALAGGGVMLDLGCHLLDLALYLFGGIARVNLMGVEYTPNTRGLEKAISVEVSFSGGYTGLLRVSRLTNLNNAITVTGVSGQAVASLVGTSLDVLIPDAPLCSQARTARVAVEYHDPFVSLWHAFHRAIEEGAAAVPDLCYGDSGVESIRAIEMLYEEMPHDVP